MTQDEGKPAQSDGPSAVDKAFQDGWDRAALSCVIWMVGKGMADEDIDSFMQVFKLVEPKP